MRDPLTELPILMMTTRVILPIVLALLVAFAALWLAPLSLVLAVRGYSPQDVIAMTASTQPQPDIVCEPDEPADSETTNTDPPTASAQSIPAIPQRTEQPAPSTDEPKTQEEPAQDEPTQPKMVATATVNVRAGKGTDTDVVGKIDPGEEVTVLENPAGDWLKVESKTTSGWVYRPLLEKR